MSEQWIKAAASYANGACVEVASCEGGVMVRDSKQNGEPGQPHLFYTHAEWSAFKEGIRAGDFDNL